MIEEFNHKLKELLRGHYKPRPFVCDGNPFNCKIFIVGFNAATEMQADFWDFWSNEQGFNKAKWFEAYVNERMNKPLKAGKIRRNKVSATRQRIEWITDAAFPSRCLETNIYTKATPETSDLVKKDMDCSVFEFLLSEIKPMFIFTHGKDAREQIEFLSGERIPEGEILEIMLWGTKTRILSMPHLSRGWSQQRSIEVVTELNKLCTGFQ